MKKILTLSIVHNHPRVLLGMKKRGFGEGRWNGFGGKVHENETIENAALRELEEEAGIVARDLEKYGIIDFEFRNDPVILTVHIFKARNFNGQPIESEEMKPSWFQVDEIPYQEMWPDDKHWLPLFLAGKKFKGKCLFENQNKIISFDLKEVAEV